jgi:enoyl-CoA hydratase/carnithine racemase
MNTALFKEITIPPFLNPESIRQLSKQITDSEDGNTRFLILKGGNEIFCNGLDLKWVANNESGDYMKEMGEYGEFLKKLQTGKCISIAAVHGSASGGGMGIVCACDHVISNETATFSLPEGLLGLIPGMILPSLLNRLSKQRIKKMVLTGQKYSADIAMAWAIVDEVKKNEEMESAINSAMNSMRSCKKEPVGDLKQLLYLPGINKDELALAGMKILNIKLNQADIRERLKDISEFLD